MRLGDRGADVITIEEPERRDAIHAWTPLWDGERTQSLEARVVATSSPTRPPNIWSPTMAPHWYIRWRPIHMPDGLDCRLDDLQVTRETFRERHEHTRLWSAFHDALYARLLCGEAVVGITGGQRVELTSAGGVVSRRLKGDDRIRLFVDEWGRQEEIVQRLPPDTPTPPPWSRSARSASEAPRSRGHGFSVPEGVTP
jgi:hypothetical protein